jgi:catechol 2,3-dioxygenase
MKGVAMASVDERLSRITSRLIDRVARVDLRVRDIDRSLRFYRDVVGLEVAESREGNASLRAPEGPILFRLDSNGVTAPAERRATGLFHVAIRFPTRGALGDVLARLIDADYQIGAGDHAVSEAIYVDDPDGNGIELYWDRPVESWPPPTDDMLVPLVTLPVDLAGVLAEGAGRGAVGAPAAVGTDIGHVHLQVADVDRTIGFYTQELGLDLIAQMGAQAAFLSSNGYHHHIGANTWNSRHGSPARRDRAGLVRVVFGVRDVDQLERARLRLGEHGRAVRGEADDDLMVSDPDEIELQFVRR